MLDKSKLIAQLHSMADELFIDHGSAHTLAHDVWRSIVADSLFIHKVKEIHDAPWPIPLWEDNLGDIISIDAINSPYTVLSVDGSQIYPDRHNVLSCFLINTGAVVLPYGVQGKKVEFYSEPKVFAGVDEHKVPFTTDTVNCKRQELELLAGLVLAQQHKSESLSLVLFDGSLIFWHLSSKEIHVRDQFLHTYLALLDNLYQERILTAWYISLPKSKELLSLVRLFLCDFDHTKKELYEVVESVVDAGIMDKFLQPHTRSIVFKNKSSISNYYPSPVHPFFFYIHTGTEIGRVEIPGWIARDEQLVNYCASVVLDQCTKGGGYPVALAEAHEQAVVKGPDRDFFYHFLQKMVIDRKQSVTISRKSLKKRGMGI